MIYILLTSYSRLLKDGGTRIKHMEDTEETEAMIKSLERYLEDLKLLVRIRSNFMNETRYKVTAISIVSNYPN